MIPCNALKRFKNERGVSSHFPITHLNSPSVFETNHLMQGSVIHLQGVAFDTETHETLNQLKRIWHQTLLGLGEELAIYVTLHRRKETTHLPGHFSQPLLQEINERYHHDFINRSIYVNDIYLTILTRNMMLKKVDSIIDRMLSVSSKSVQKSYNFKRELQIKKLENTVRQILTSLSEFGPRLLGDRDQELGYSELLRFLSLFLNGDTHFKPGFFYPLENLSSYLSSHRLFFGSAIEFKGGHEDKSRYAAMVSIKKYAPQTNCFSMDGLLKIESEYLLTNTFLVESKEVVQRLINRHRRRMENVNDPAKSQIKNFSLLQDQLASDRIIMGLHHNTIMLMENSLEKLDQSVAKTIKYYSDVGFVAIRESIGQEPAYWAQIPGNIKMIVRSALITSENFVDFCPLHNYRTGYRDQNHLGSAVTILKTRSHTPFFFNFHTKGSQDNPSKGHTTLIGGNGCGKTVAMAFFDSQLSRYSGRTFVFDRDRGLEIYLRSCGGYYAVLSPEHSDRICFNPFQMLDTAINRKFCREWFGQLIKEEGEGSLPASLSDLVSECVDYVFTALPVEERRLSNAAKLLPISFSRWPHLRRWLRAEGIYPEGEYAYLFDNVKDDFQMQKKMGFDLTHFLDIEPSHVLASVMMYLFHRLEQSFDGSLVTVLLDEAWQYLDNIYWKQKLRKWLPTLRKLNCHLILATQSPSSVVESSIRNMILDNIATHIYFTNPQAKPEHYQIGFNLTESEFRCIKENNPSDHYFLLKQDHESSLCCLDLSMMSDMLPIFSANRSTLQLLDKLQEKYGKNVNDWLPKFRQNIKL